MKKTTVLLIMSLMTVIGLTVYAIASPGSITNNGDGTWTYQRTASEATWNNYVTYYTENWPDKYYSWLETTGGCVVDPDSEQSRDEQLDACKTPAKAKAYLEDHLDAILDGEYLGEKQEWTSRQYDSVSGSLD